MSKLPKSRSYAYFLLLLNTTLWGFSGPIIKFGLGFISPENFLFYRFLIATLLFTPFFLLYRQKHRQKIHYPTTLFLALLGTPLTLLPLFYGLDLTTSIEASILDATSPVFIIFGGLLFLNEKLTKREWQGFLITLLGTALLIFDPIINGGAHVKQLSLTGNGLIMLSNLLWAIFLLVSKKLKVDAIVLTFFSFLVSIPFFLFLTLKTGLEPLALPALPSVLYMAIGSSIIAFWAYSEGQKHIEASEAAIFGYLRPLFALPLGLLWLKEPMTPLSVASLVLITSGVFFSEKR